MTKQCWCLVPKLLMLSKFTTPMASQHRLLLFPLRLRPHSSELGRGVPLCRGAVAAPLVPSASHLLLFHEHIFSTVL